MVYNIESSYKDYTSILDLFSAIERCLHTTPKTQRKERGHGAKKNRYCSNKTLMEWTHMLRMTHREWVKKVNGNRINKYSFIYQRCVEKIEKSEKNTGKNLHKISKNVSLKDIWYQVNTVRGTATSSATHTQRRRQTNIFRNGRGHLLWLHYHKALEMP